MTEAEAAKPGEGGQNRPRALSLSLLVALCITLTFLAIPRQPYLVDDSLSYNAVLNYAHEHGLQSGTDIVFSYGPLGFLTSRYFFPHAATARIVVDVLVCFSVAAGVCVAAWRLGGWWKYLLLGVFVWLSANIDPRTDLLLYVGLLCWGLLCLVESGGRLIVCVSVFTVLAAFGILIKGTFLFIAGLSVAAIVLDRLARGNLKLAAGLVVGMGVVLAAGWTAAGQHISGVPSFCSHLLCIIRGYDQVMGFDGLQILRTRGLLTVALATATVIARALTAFDAQQRHLALRRWLLLAWLASLVFIICKHGFVRADLYHMGFFFGFAPILALALEVLPCARPAARNWARGFGLACCLITALTLNSFFFADLKSSLIQPFRAARENLLTLLNPAEYRQQMQTALEEVCHLTDLPKLREIVGRSPVDVFGQHQCYALLNGLNYYPRPVFQSYATFNAHLMRLNEQFYLSQAAPDYVLFALNQIDHKFPPLEDAMLLRDLLIDYELVAAEEPFLLLKSKSAALPKLTLLREGTVRPGEPIRLNDFGDDNLWMEIAVEPTLLGRVRHFLYKPPKIRLAVWGESTSRRPARYPAPTPMLAAGFLASPLVLHGSDVSNLYTGASITRPKAYSVEPLRGEEHFWKDQMRFRIYKIENKLGQ